MVWQSLLDALPGLADEPYHPLFAYNTSFVLKNTIKYLVSYRNNPAFVVRVQRSLRKDRPGSSSLAAALIAKGQKACLPEAMEHALKVIGRPDADGTDVSSAINLVLRYGTEKQRHQYASLANEIC